MKRENRIFVVPQQQISSFPVKQSLIDEITNVLQKVPIVENLARKKFISQYVIALVKAGIYNFVK